MALRMRWTKRESWLLLANLVAVPVLSWPAFGFIAYMNRRGILLFVIVAWTSATVVALFFWPLVSRRHLAAAYMLAAAAAIVPVTLALGVALHPLYWRPGAGIAELARWVGDAVSLGGIFTAGYWLPASALNCYMLRRRVA